MNVYVWMRYVLVQSVVKPSKAPYHLICFIVSMMK